MTVDSPVLAGPFVVGGKYEGCFTKQAISGSADDLIAPKRGVSFGSFASAN
ncbi:hypothetical protein [Streptomyces decoyicus]